MTAASLVTGVCHLEPSERSQSIRRFLPSVEIALIVLTLGGCSAEVATRLTEEQANRVVVALDQSGIPADKIRQSASGPRVLYRIEVKKSSLGRALSVLQASGVLGEQEPEWERILERRGLVPTASEEQARLAAAMSGEIARSIETVDGVIDARVHLSLPGGRKAGLDRPPNPSRASVLVRYRNATPPIERDDIRQLVAGAVPGLARERVAVVMVQSAPTKVGPASLVRIGPVGVTAESAAIFKALLAGLLSLVGILSATVIWLLTCSRKARYPNSGTKEA